MRRPPPYSQIHRFPVTGGIALLAIGVNVANWFGDVEPLALVMDSHVQNGQPWRFVTAVLPHANFIHLAFNLVWLWTFGTIIEQALGTARTFALYVFLALGSMAAEYAFFRGGIGLSGVVYGCWGLCYVLSRRDPRFEGATDRRVDQMLFAWFFICIGLTWADILPIANVAHGTGAVLGAGVGLAMSFRPKASWWLLTVGLAGSFVVTALRFRPWVNLSRDGNDEAVLGFQAVKSGRLAEGERWYRAALRIEPTDQRAWFNLGLIYWDTNRREAALDCFARAVELDPGTKLYREELERRSRELNRPAGADPTTQPEP